MVGDVNLFLHPYLYPAAELEVMIAHSPSQRRGIATEALHLLMAFARTSFHVHSFIAKVGGANDASLRLFRERLGFEDVAYVDVFDEWELKSPACQCDECKRGELEREGAASSMEAMAVTSKGGEQWKDEVA